MAALWLLPAWLVALPALADGPAVGDVPPTRPAAVAPAELASLNEDCLDCHDAAEDTLQLADGSTLVVGVSGEAFGASVHGNNTPCVGCHRGIAEHPHPKVTAPGRKEYRQEQTRSCQRCHYAYHTRVLDGIHFKMLNEGRDAPGCVDCHGAHEMVDPLASRKALNRRCGDCHMPVFKRYRASAHGGALAEQGGEDLPLCIDCHGAHGISDPRKSGQRVRSHEICGRCHGDAERMAPYGLNTDVMSSYLDDFHGVSNKLYAAGAGKPMRRMATCTDCHGVHDATSFKNNGDNKAAIRARLAPVCQECHPGSDVALTDAWLSHYPASISRAPLVWGIRWIYRVLIPLIMLGLIGHILLHLWSTQPHRGV